MRTGTTISDFREQSLAAINRRTFICFAIPGLILAYLGYVFFAFEVNDALQGVKLDNAKILVGDSYSYKTVVSHDNRSGRYVVAIEGEKKGRYAPDSYPAWVLVDGQNAEVDLSEGYRVTVRNREVSFVVPGYGQISALPTRRGVEVELPDGPIPSWINLSKTRLNVKTPNGRVSVTKTKTTIFRYFFGWELFWFTLDSPYNGLGLMDLAAAAISGEQNKNGQIHALAIFRDFWFNPMWRHGEVAWALVETVLMAFLGTIGAAFLALPLGFLSARNFCPSLIGRFGMRRLFDFLRGVDGLIWTVILSRAFGPGPMTGALAILITDTGTFGKMFSEALENVDEKQIEGLKSTGASPVSQNRFGVIPQITPVLLSQILYYLESNTRSATIIGAIVGGGIGLLLTQAIITQKDWEEVTYYIILIVMMVFIMDSLSGWLRRRLIKGNA